MSELYMQKTGSIKETKSNKANLHGQRLDAGVLLLKSTLPTLPKRPGVYRFIDAGGTILYIGKAKILQNRVGSYAQPNRLPLRLQRMVSRLAAIEITLTRTESEALLLEANLIKKHQPPYNVLLKDSKDYAYLLIATDHDFPQLMRHRGAKKREGHYYGPFASGQAVGETLETLQRAFLLRNCTDNIFKSRRRPCLQYDIKRCTAPCVGYADKAAYAAQVKQAQRFFAGQTEALTEQLADAMEKASASQQYERAALLRDRIRALAAVKARQEINLDTPEDVDLFALVEEQERYAVQVFFFRGGRNFGGRVLFPQQTAEESAAELLGIFLAQFYTDHPPPAALLLSHQPEEAALLATALSEKAGHTVKLRVPQRGPEQRLVALASENALATLRRQQAESASQKASMEKLAAAFHLKTAPQRIEIYDNSHIQGTHAVGAMVVANAEGFQKNAYRKFNMPTKLGGGDDIFMMQEMLRRRFRGGITLQETAPESWPDLLLIDGGLPQLHAAMQVLKELGIDALPLAAIAKGPERNKGKERIFLPQQASPVQLAANDPLLFFLQRLRDEAHRFAIGTHRARRQKAALGSPLDGVPGIGPTRKRALLRHFGSAQAVARAQISDLCRVQGISDSTAQQIYAYFHPHG